MNQIYRIKKAFTYPFITAVILLGVLLVVSLFSGQSWERAILAVLFVLAALVAVEASERTFSVSDDGLRIRKFFRIKNFSWAEITHLGVVVMRHKAYFLLTTTKGFYIFSNLLQDHALLIRRLTEKLENERVEAEIKTYLESPVERTSLIVLTWIALIIIVAIILTKLFTA
ncbi:MAG: hypothetical protein EG826_14600 [Deltaproteobacteria bacterium]|nr:hypothetical protein [Deltaproteobacteria bacterium]